MQYIESGLEEKELLYLDDYEDVDDRRAIWT